MYGNNTTRTRPREMVHFVGADRKRLGLAGKKGDTVQGHTHPRRRAALCGTGHVGLVHSMSARYVLFIYCVDS